MVLEKWELGGLKAVLEGRSRRQMKRPEKAAVLVPIVDDGGVQRVILTRRSEKVGTHKGQVSFPGGFVEADDRDSCHTALRESEEEIGLDPGVVEVLGGLDDFPAILPRVQVTPWVGRICETPVLEANPREVARIFEVPLEALSRKEGWREQQMVRGDMQWPVYFFDYDGEVVWGLTGYILLLLLSDSPWGSPFEIRTDRFI